MITEIENETPLVSFGTTSKERVEHAINELRLGKGILLLDDKDRENEGDLVYSAQNMSVEDMALMIRECSGIVCLCLSNKKADELELPYMVKENTSLFQTPFTVTIEAKEGVTTGLSASDRIQTIRTASADNAKPSDLVKPGHIFPLRANDNGVLQRNGHTEGSVDLMKLSGLKPEAVLCELMNPNGTMARLPEILSFAKKHQLVVLTIADIVHYRKFVRDFI
ncbi:3,4-dihydroxy-2-butanone-4-phosphate synthase [Flavobacterium sp. LS1R47]|jgi:3,4-dihydroxy 2-butanone 4-phosphate synthase|uniref:3,4-dihydroxy-2-butanone 4-phosphate synthase n=1 Tax=Flavobacterium frigoritolerans TaxID=2987686 RepID=A0A9X2Z0C1_9FLAO|nr:3,4-dihydroxy-2-butanone-4-phosphate synthase [Flavobacterium frigoritolerans]MCV9933318.1 3,4-dihydroxy-2-butanone-4-phosphate synthase [Flavobacterium frigoritolerans]